MPNLDSLENIKKELADFSVSPLYAYRIENNNLPVIGEGNPHAKIIFIGEAPGKNEAKTGKPFCGASGRILDELLAHIKLDRKKVYVTNIVKDRPPENRDPTSSEIALYAPFLDRQIEIIKPKIIATLGRFSMQYIMQRYGLGHRLQSISKIHGKKFKAKIENTEFVILPLYHPAVSVYNAKTKDILKKDFKTLKKYI